MASYNQTTSGPSGPTGHGEMRPIPPHRLLPLPTPRPVTPSGRTLNPYPILGKTGEKTRTLTLVGRIKRLPEHVQRRIRFLAMPVSPVVEELRWAADRGATCGRALEALYQDEYYYDRDLYRTHRPAERILSVQYMRSRGYFCGLHRVWPYRWPRGAKYPPPDGFFTTTGHVNEVIEYPDPDTETLEEAWRAGWPRHCWCALSMEQHKAT